MNTWTLDVELDRERAAAALAQLRGAPLGEHDHAEALARVVWNVLIEPGDRTAGFLIEAVGAYRSLRLMMDRASVEAMVAASRGDVNAEHARDAIDRWSPRMRASDVLRTLESAVRCGARLVLPGDEHWPPALEALGPSTPLLIWALGDTALLCRPGVAVVGARAATGYGEHVAMEFAAGLAGREVVVVSGGAYGIDGMAHRAALASDGSTIAVLAGGLDRFYPSGHDALLTRISERGLVITEAPCGSAPTKWRFLQRNRLIAALAAATIVVEAGRRSGALNTASHAIDVGRPVGVVPGPITSAASAGCHAIIRRGNAECITSVPEIIQLAFGDDGVLTIPEHDRAAPVDAMEVRVLDALRPHRGLSEIDIARAVGESEDRVRGVLGVLALDERAEYGQDGRWRRARASKTSIER